MQSDIWKKAVAAAIDPHRAGQFIEQLRQTIANDSLRIAKAPQADVFCALLSGSRAAGEALAAHPQWVSSLLEPGFLDHPWIEQSLRREVDGWLKPMLKSGDCAGALANLRLFKQREMVRIAARDLARLAKTPETLDEISNVADVCLDAVFQICWKQLTDRFGAPYHLDVSDRWQPTQFSVIGLGKLGGQELNYSSDIDVVFVYSEEGSVFKSPPRGAGQAGRGLANHPFFTRLSEALIAEISRMTPEGSLFRIDLRLRPEGDSGPLARSLESYENYYAQWGQTWERMMLIKARTVAGDKELGAEFLEMVHPFRYPRSFNERVLHEISAMKKRIENEVVKAGELDRNVKLGRGGIREIEFIAQTLQLLHAGRLPFLQNAQTIPVLHKTAHYHLLEPDDVKALHNAYYFLRDVEHRLQMDNWRQTHTIPTERVERERLGRLMGFDTLEAFEQARQAHCATVRAIYEKVLPAESPVSVSALPDEIESAAPQWKEILARHSFRDVDKAFKMTGCFIQGPGYVHVSPRTVELARALFPRFLALCPKKGGGVHGAGGSENRQTGGLPHKDATLEQSVKKGAPVILSDPDRVLVRLDSFISAYGARSTLYELWTQNPAVFELLLMLFDRSEFLAETAIRTPDLVDELEMSGRLRKSKNAAEILRDLRYGLDDEDQRLWIRRYHQTEQMRIGLRDILELADFTQGPAEISALADACLQYALEVVMRKHKLKKPPFCVIGLGKLGGQEIDYGSDLDIIFVTDAPDKKLPELQRLALDLMDLVSGQSELGVAFEIDARLRPDGEKGLIVNNFSAYEDYYRKRASLWEIQTITRVRPVAGDLEIGGRFQQLAGALANFSPENVAAGFMMRFATGKAKTQSGLAAYAPDWKRRIARMRERIEKERTPAGKDDLAIKTGSGGLIDAEFMAQAFCLANGWQEPNTARALERARQSGALDDDDGQLLSDSYRALHRIECILRRWSFEGEVLLPDDPAPMYRVAVRCGFPDAQSFLEHVGAIRRAIRSVYLKVFP